jgi:hypothetical protein
VTQTIIVTKATVALSIAASPNPVFLLNPVTLSVSVTTAFAPATGSVTFSDGTTPLGTAVMNAGTASLAVSSLTLGTHTITAAYSGDGNYLPAVSSSVAVVVEDFSVTLSNPNVVIPHGGTATYTFAVSPIGGPTMPSGINLSVTGGPYSSVISFNPATITAGSGTTTVTLTVQTPDYPVGPWTQSRNGTGLGRAALAFTVLGTLLLPLRRKRKLLHRLGLLVLLVAVSSAVLTATGCGSGWGPQPYSLAVTGTSGALTHSANASLISQ